MPREKFEHDMKRLQEEILSLGVLAENAVLASVEALRTQDLDKAREIIDGDRPINERRFALENEALTLIATQQPMASDLRALAAVLELATELERIADYAKGIANIALMIGKNPLIKPLQDIPLMAKKACAMLHASLEAYVSQDVRRACRIPTDDEEVDALYEKVYRDLVALIIADQRVLDQAMRLTWVAHNLERVADRVGNICERVIFSITGRIEELTDSMG
jgi:phosphate transport system protein